MVNFPTCIVHAYFCIFSIFLKEKSANSAFVNIKREKLILFIITKIHKSRYMEIIEILKTNLGWILIIMNIVMRIEELAELPCPWSLSLNVAREEVFVWCWSKCEGMVLRLPKRCARETHPLPTQVLEVWWPVENNGMQYKNDYLHFHNGMQYKHLCTCI